MSARRVGAELESVIAGRPATGIESGPAPERTRPPVLPDAPIEKDADHVAPPGLSPPTPFIGRGSELAELAELFRDPAVRLVTIVGPGGMGKSRLAIEAARLMAAGRGAFEETVPGSAPLRRRYSSSSWPLGLARAACDRDRERRRPDLLSGE